MTDEQFEGLAGKLDRIIELLEAQQQNASNVTFQYVQGADPVLPDPFEWPPATLEPPHPFDSAAAELCVGYDPSYYPWRYIDGNTQAKER